MIWFNINLVKNIHEFELNVYNRKLRLDSSVILISSNNSIPSYSLRALHFFLIIGFDVSILCDRKISTSYWLNTHSEFINQIFQSSNKMPDIKKYTHAQVKEHNNENDLWLIINDKVYDVTKFMKEVSFFLSFCLLCTLHYFITLFHVIVHHRNDRALISFFKLASRWRRSFDWCSWNKW